MKPILIPETELIIKSLPLINESDSRWVSILLIFTSNKCILSYIVLILPFWLLCVLPSKSDKIYHYIREHTSNIESIGDVCIYGKFNRKNILDIEDDSEEINPNLDDESQMSYSRLQKSIDSFRSCHPGWKPSTLENLQEP